MIGMSQTIGSAAQNLILTILKNNLFTIWRWSSKLYQTMNWFALSPAATDTSSSLHTPMVAATLSVTYRANSIQNNFHPEVFCLNRPYLNWFSYCLNGISICLNRTCSKLRIFQCSHQKQHAYQPAYSLVTRQASPQTSHLMLGMSQTSESAVQTLNSTRLKNDISTIWRWSSKLYQTMNVFALSPAAMDTSSSSHTPMVAATPSVTYSAN